MVSGASKIEGFVIIYKTFYFVILHKPVWGRQSSPFANTPFSFALHRIRYLSMPDKSKVVDCNPLHSSPEAKAKYTRVLFTRSLA